MLKLHKINNDENSAELIDKSEHVCLFWMGKSCRFAAGSQKSKSFPQKTLFTCEQRSIFIFVCGVDSVHRNDVVIAQGGAEAMQDIGCLLCS